MAFFPPKPASYFTVEDTAGKIHVRYTDGGSQIAAGGRLAAYDAHYVETKRKNKIVVFSMDAPTGKDPQKAITLIVSHGNALDAALFVPFGRRLRDTLNVNIVLYDYSGYGTSTGKPGVKNIYADLEAVVHWCVTEKQMNPGRIVLYGQSIGSAPTCRYASKAGEVYDAYEKVKNNKGASQSKLKKNKVQPLEKQTDCLTSSIETCLGKKQTHHLIGGVILISPILSGLHVVSGDGAGCCAPANVFSTCDVFPNGKSAPKIRCPTLVMHGTKDVQVPFSHGQRLFDGLKGEKSNGQSGLIGALVTSGDIPVKAGAKDSEKSAFIHPDPYWVLGAGHDDVYERNVHEFVARVRNFLTQVLRVADLEDLKESRADFNSIREGAEKSKEASDFNSVRDEAEMERDVSIEMDILPGNVKKSARRDDGAPVKTQVMMKE